MSTKETGGPAFPVSTTHGEIGHQDTGTTWQFPGMTLRDYMAAKAMAVVPPQAAYNMLPKETGEAYIARRAYAYADAMLVARSAT